MAMVVVSTNIPDRIFCRKVSGLDILKQIAPTLYERAVNGLRTVLYAVLSQDDSIVNDLVVLYNELKNDENRSSLDIMQVLEALSFHSIPSEEVVKKLDEMFYPNLIPILTRLGNRQKLGVLDIALDNVSMWNSIYPTLSRCSRPEPLDRLRDLVFATDLGTALWTYLVLSLLTYDDILVALKWFGDTGYDITRFVEHLVTVSDPRHRDPRKLFKIVDGLITLFETLRSGNVSQIVDRVYDALGIYGDARRYVSVSIKKLGVENGRVVVNYELTVGSRRDSGVVEVVSAISLDDVVDSICGDVVSRLSRLGIHIAGSRSRRISLVVEATNNKFVVLYPYNKTYTYRELRELMIDISRYVDYNDAIPIYDLFAKYAERHGIKYTRKPFVTYKVLLQNRRPFVFIGKIPVDGVEKLLMVTHHGQILADDIVDLVEKTLSSALPVGVKKTVVEFAFRTSSPDDRKRLEYVMNTLLGVVYKISCATNDILTAKKIGNGMVVYVSTDKKIVVSDRPLDMVEHTHLIELDSKELRERIYAGVVTDDRGFSAVKTIIPDAIRRGSFVLVPLKYARRGLLEKNGVAITYVWLNDNGRVYDERLWIVIRYTNPEKVLLGNDFAVLVYGDNKYVYIFNKPAFQF